MVKIRKFMSEVTKEQVSEAMTEPVEAAPTNEVKEESSREVNPESDVKSEDTQSVDTKPAEEKVEEDKQKDDSKDVSNDHINDQIKNLNTALSLERDERKRLKEELEQTKSFSEKLKSAFAPEEVKPETVEETEQEKFEKWYAEKESAKAEEKKTEEIQKTITTQIDTLSKEWDWQDGKPKYDDAEVYSWQRENWKTHLMPEEAFFLMKRNDLMDWKSNQTVSKAKSGTSSEKPSWISAEHTPTKTEPKTERELKDAVLEAMSSSEDL